MTLRLVVDNIYEAKGLQGLKSKFLQLRYNTSIRIEDCKFIKHETNIECSNICKFFHCETYSSFSLFTYNLKNNFMYPIETVKLYFSFMFLVYLDLRRCKTLKIP